MLFTKPDELQQRLINIALKEVGQHEVPLGSNSGPRVMEYQATTDLKKPKTGWAWCAAFVDWCILQWLQDPEVRVALKLSPKDIESWRPKTALAYGYTAWAKSKGIKVLPKGSVAKVGDIIMFNNASHVGLVEKVVNNLIYTVEGNTNKAGSREGTHVMKKIKANTVIKNLVRIIP